MVVGHFIGVLCRLRLALSDQQPLRHLRGFRHCADRISERSRMGLGQVPAAK